MLHVIQYKKLLRDMGRVFGGQEKYTSYGEGQTRWKNANPASNIMHRTTTTTTTKTTTTASTTSTTTTSTTTKKNLPPSPSLTPPPPTTTTTTATPTSTTRTRYVIYVYEICICRLVHCRNGNEKHTFVYIDENEILEFRKPHSKILTLQILFLLV
jgi:hypothetical protein